MNAPSGPPSPEEALAALRALGDPGRAAGAAARRPGGHDDPPAPDSGAPESQAPVPQAPGSPPPAADPPPPRRTASSRATFGAPKPAVDALAADWRAACPTLDARVALAAALWDSGVLEARLAAAHLLVQARIRDDASVWRLILAWTPEIDGPAIAEEVARAASRRLAAHPARLDDLEGWIAPDRPPWTRRAAFAFTLPWAKLTHPSPEDLARRERILGWAAAAAPDPDPRLQSALGAWLASLSKHDPERVREFLAEHGHAMAAPTRKDVARRLP